jgi:flagellin
MALAIATNNAALNAAASASSVNRDMETSMARLSTGKRINSASDDAAGVAISSRLSAEIRGTDQAIRNSLDGQALIDTAEGAHKEIENILQRMREVSVQAANDTNNKQDRANLQAEMNAMGTEIDRIAGTTTWAGANLMEDGTSTFSFQVGTATGTKNQIEVEIESMNMGGLNIGSTASSAAFTITVGDIATPSELKADGTDDYAITAVTGGATLVPVASNTDGVITITHPSDSTKVYTAEIGTSHAETAQNIRAAFADIGVGAEVASATTINLTFATVPQVTTSATNISVQSTHARTGSGSALDAADEARKGVVKIDAAIKEVNVQRSKLGATSNRLNHTVNNLTNISSNLSAAKGGIEDADFALETTNLAKNQILQQASTAMLAQANASKQNVLSLLQG